jgi:hypothetical protein
MQKVGCYREAEVRHTSKAYEAIGGGRTNGKSAEGTKTLDALGAASYLLLYPLVPIHLILESKKHRACSPPLEVDCRGNLYWNFFRSPPLHHRHLLVILHPMEGIVHP